MVNKFLNLKGLGFLLLLLSAFASCKDDTEAETSVNVNLSAKPQVDGSIDADMLKNLEVTITEVRNQNASVVLLSESGFGTVTLEKGVYNIAAKKVIKSSTDADSIYISSLMENVTINDENQLIELKVIALPASSLNKGFIFSEIFFNGEQNSGRMMHPDQYFVIFNPTSEVLYADGLCVAVTHHLAWQDKQLWYDDFYPNRVPIGGFVTIPGSGKEHPVKPGEKLVVAFTAIDHSAVEGYDHAVDLTGADFEVYKGPDNNDVDNPDVPNVLLTENGDSYGFFFQPRGYFSPLMFKLKDGNKSTVEQFYNENIKTSKRLVAATDSTEESIVDIQILSVPVDDILDGVQTSDVPQDVKTRVIPEIVDRGKFLVNGCHRQELAIRKEIHVGSVVYYQDTNDSSNDFVMQKGQNSFPKGWRKK